MRSPSNRYKASSILPAVILSFVMTPIIFGSPSGFALTGESYISDVLTMCLVLFHLMSLRRQNFNGFFFFGLYNMNRV
jgi:hypothetical protein